MERGRGGGGGGRRGGNSGSNRSGMDNVTEGDQAGALIVGANDANQYIRVDKDLASE